jgi:hypothetical protein
MDLAPGSYGRLFIPNGSTLLLPEFGEYTFCDVKVGRMATLLAHQQITTNVAGSFLSLAK